MGNKKIHVKDKLINLNSSKKLEFDKFCIFFQTCDEGRGECVKYYLCQDGKLNTDGSDLIDIRFDGDAGNECGHYLLSCCGIAKENIPHPVSNPQIDKPSVNKNQIPTRGLRNKNGIGFRISGGFNESEFDEKK